MKRTFGRRINTWLAEPKGEIFRDGKWRFWFPTLLGLTALNATMTAVIFGADGAQKYIGSIVVLAGAVLCWLALGLLHYSDSEDRALAIGVAILDSLTLLFVAAHFSFLLWCQGHLWTLRSAERQYREDMITYNEQWKPVKDSNERIASSVERIAQIEKETERLRNDTAYWSRRNKVQPPRSGIKFEAAVTPMEVPPPPKEPTESSAAFLATWDSWIRMAGFGELGLSIITLIFVRTRTATRNRIGADEVFPDELDADVVEDRRTGGRLDRTRKSDSGAQSPLSLSFDREKARYALLEHLKTVSFYYPRHTFKVDLIAGGVIIRMVRKEHGVETTVASTTQSNKLLAAVDRPDFRERLVDELIRQNFPIEKDDVN
jgi:hypothetical protein